MSKRAPLWRIVFLVFPCFFVTHGFCEKIDRIAAIVNGDIITEEELGLFTRMAAMDESLQGGASAPAELRKRLLDQMIEDRLLLQEAKRLELKPDEKILDERLGAIKERAGSEAAFEHALKEQGITLAELKEKLKNQFLIYLVIQNEVRNKILVNPKDVTDYFEKNRELFVVPESASVDSIFVEDESALADVERRLEGGEDFETVSSVLSKKSNLGVVLRGQLKKELEDAVFGLQPGERSRPVPVDGGYFIFRLKEKTPPSQQPLDAVREKIRSELDRTKMQVRLKEWVESLKDKAYISIRE